MKICVAVIISIAFELVFQFQFLRGPNSNYKNKIQNHFFFANTMAAALKSWDLLKQGEVFPTFNLGKVFPSHVAYMGRNSYGEPIIQMPITKYQDIMQIALPPTPQHWNKERFIIPTKIGAPSRTTKQRAALLEREITVQLKVQNVRPGDIICKEGQENDMHEDLYVEDIRLHSYLDSYILICTDYLRENKTHSVILEKDTLLTLSPRFLENKPYTPVQKNKRKPKPQEDVYDRISKICKR